MACWVVSVITFISRVHFSNATDVDSLPGSSSTGMMACLFPNGNDNDVCNKTLDQQDDDDDDVCCLLIHCSATTYFCV